MTIKCHEYFGCKHSGCVMFNENEERNCWELESHLTPCTDTFVGPLKIEDKKVFCKNCLYYEHITKSLKK